MLGSPAGPGGPSQRGLWPLAPAPAPTATSFSADGLSKYGVYSLFPGGPTFGSALYSHASTIGRFASGQFQQTSGNAFHTAHKVSDSLFSASGYTFGAPTPPPGSPYSPIPVTQLELLAKGFNSNIIIQQPDYPMSPKKMIQDKMCEEKCCSLKPQKACSCQLGSPMKGSKYTDTITGCSRTNPIEWSGVNVKKEPGACQVAEISTSASPIVKLEVTSPTQKNGDNGLLGNSIITNGGNIPVGIAIARQRIQQEVIASPSLPPTSLLTTINGGAQIKEIARISEIDPSVATGSMAAGSTMGGQQGGTLLQCTDDRGAGLAAWQMGGPHSQTLATPTLWQYPAPVPVEPMVPLPVPMPPVGFQLVRDPTTGGLLLLPTTGLESLQQAVVWPSYPQHSSVLLPSLPPIPPPPLQLLSSASSDYLSSSTTLHQHTQTHSTRLVAVTTDSKRKIPMPIPTTTFIKIETDATMDQTKTLQAVSAIGSNTGTVYTDPNMTPLVTTHVIYQHPTNLILSQTPTGETSCRSQATSPVTCLTPPPEAHIQEEEPSMVQDASNQTDTPINSEDDNTTHTISDVVGECKGKLEKSVFDHTDEYCDRKSPTVPDVMEEAQEPPGEYIVQTNAAIEERAEQEPENAPEAEAMPPQTPDLSGLELLSNSIVEFESCRNKAEEQVVPKTFESEEVLNAPLPMLTDVNIKNEIAMAKPPVDDSLGGLGLLCALAEQRIMEENETPKLEKERSKERKKEKRKSKKHSSDEPRRKKIKSDRHHEEREQRKRDKYLIDKTEADKEKRHCSCHEENYRTYKSPESEEEVRKFIASKTQPICCKGDWPYMNAMELDMRMKLAELQRQYREKQKELSKCKPKRHSTDCSSKKRPRKKSTHSAHSDRSSTPPPLLDKMDVPVQPNADKPELLKPPTLCAMPKLDEIYKTQSDVDSSPEKYSSSKKRKVGRPKKLMSSSGEHVATETIVAKKPKSSFVGYLLAAKEKLKLQNKTYPDATPPRYVEETVIFKPKKTKNNNHIVTNEVKSSNIRPKLRAEATVKTYADDDQNEWETVVEEEEGEEEEAIDHIEEDLDEDEIDKEEVDNVADPAEDIAEPEENTVEAEIVEEVKPEDTRCTLTAELLDVDKLRVLTAMGGLFYAGQLNALEPPDVYSITLDGERGNRPHIMSREEILRDAIVEVAPKSTQDLPSGTRVCAYWSQQYRCLYPGSVAEPGTPDPLLDEKFVSVEFDDGDSGRIDLEDIRLLPTDYPIIEYDPNPLLSLSKRRRRASTSVSTEEKLPKTSQMASTLPPSESQKAPKDLPIEKENKDVNKPSLDQHKEKKRLKKKKREKLREKFMHDDKKKKRKHKCNDENCKHRKHHKKHRKHKKHHDKVRSEEKEQVEIEDQIDEPEEESEVVEDVEESALDQNNAEEFAEVDEIANPEDEVTMDDIIKATKSKKSKKIRDRQESCESRSKMSAFLPARQLWRWAGKGYKRQRAKGRSKKCFYKTIQRGKETITVGDSAVFLSTGRPDRPYIGRIEAMWELCGTMVVRVKWFYHPEETIGCPQNLHYPGALFESPHVDENDVQTISHKCEVLPLEEYTERLGDDPQRYAMIYDNNDIYYLAGYYDPTTHTIKMEPGIPFKTD